MATFIGPKRKLSRREGVALFPKDIKALERKGVVVPGQHGVRTRRKTSEYLTQLRAKQRAKRIYGILEKQFKKYFKMASLVRGATSQALLQLLEGRLDNIVYRLGFAQTRAQARQFVTHGHIKLDDKKATIPSIQVKVGSTIALQSSLMDNIQVKKSLQIQETLPGWLERKATVGKVLRNPDREEMEQAIDEQLIVEYYSR